VDTLEVFEEAIQKAGEEAPVAHTGYNAHDQDGETEHVAPPTDPLPQHTQNNNSTRGRGGGRGARPRPTKVYDPAKTQRQLEHTQRKEQAAAARRAWDAAREAARLATIPENDPSTPATTPQPPLSSTLPPPQPIVPPTLLPLQPPNPDILNPINPPPPDSNEVPEEERFCDTEIEDELELPATSQISGSKELFVDPAEDETTSKSLERKPPPNL